MKPRDPKARSREALREAVDRYGRERARATRGPEPWPGDVYVLAETSGIPVEWLVVERTPRHCRLVAADTHPALGSADVPVPAEAEGGPLSVRCAVSLQVGIETLRRGERTGTVAPEILEPVRRRLEELAAGPAGDEPDSDPEAEDWREEVLEPARAALLLARKEEETRPSRRFGFRVAVAAVLLLLVALGALSLLTWRLLQNRERLALREVERLIQERREMESEHQRQLASLREAQNQNQARRPPEPPPPAPDPEPLLPLINLAYAVFYPDETRGAQEEIAVPSQATHLFLLLYVGNQESCREYELEVARRGAPTASFTVQELRPLPSQEVSVAIPRTQLPDGSYQLQLYGVCDGERRELGTFEARLKENAR